MDYTKAIRTAELKYKKLQQQSADCETLINILKEARDKNDREKLTQLKK